MEGGGGTLALLTAPATASAPRLGRYELCSRIASGGMASVYLARASHARGVERIVALKVIHRHLAVQQTFTDMFLDEASIASSFSHPNICTVFDFGEDGGRLYLAMEYLAGESLSRFGRRIAKRRERDDVTLLPTVAAQIVAHAAMGLHHAHDQVAADGSPLEVVHRDVSPENILVTYDGAVKVVDFGVAKAAHRHHETKVAKIKGKFAYVAPEQLRNEPLDRRADVWGLGVCLWEALVLRRLFRRENEAATLSAVLFDEIAPPSTIRPWVPPELDTIVMRALARDPKERFATAAEMAHALRDWLHSSPYPMGTSELGDWMKELFAEEYAERLTRLHDARNGLFDEDLDLEEAATAEATMPSVSYGAVDHIEAIERAARAARAAEPTVQLRREPGAEADAEEADDALMKTLKRRRRRPWILLAMLVLLAVPWVIPSTRATLMNWINPPPAEVVEAAPEPGTLRVQVTPPTAEVALFIGRSPVSVSVPAGDPARFLIVDGATRTVRIVPTDATWSTADGAPHYDLAISLAPEGEAQTPEAPNESDAARQDAASTVRVITTPPGTKVYRLLPRAEGTDAATLEDLNREALVELLVFQEGLGEERLLVDAARWNDDTLLELDVSLTP